MKASASASIDLFSEDYRLDASYHSSFGHQAIKQLIKSQKKLERLDTVCMPEGIYIPSRFKRVFVDDPKHGIPYLTGGSILQTEPLQGAKLLSSKYTANMEKLSLAEKMILITCSGDIGKAVYVNQSLLGAIGSPDLIRVIGNPEKIFSGYLYAYLSSPHARALLQQKTYGAVIPHIEAHHIVDLPIPRLGLDIEQQINKYIDRAAKLRADANLLIENARNKLLSSNHLPILTPNDYYFYRSVTRASDQAGVFSISSSGLTNLTINAWNYSDKFASLRGKLMKTKYAVLSDVLTPDGYTTGSSYKRIPMPIGEGIEFIGQKDMFGIRKVGKWISKMPIGSIELEEAKDGTILIAGVGTNAETEVFGRCEFVWKNFTNKLIAAEVIRVKADPKKIDPGYLFALLSSDYGFRLLRSTITGTKLCRFIEPMVLSFPIPMVDSIHEQMDIGNMVRQAYDYRAQAIELEDQAQALLSTSLGMKNSPMQLIGA